MSTETKTPQAPAPPYWELPCCGCGAIDKPREFHRGGSVKDIAFCADECSGGVKGPLAMFAWMSNCTCIQCNAKQDFDAPRVSITQRDGQHVITIITCSKQCSRKFRKATNKECKTNGRPYHKTCSGPDCEETSPAKLKSCGGCGIPQYCSKECQRAHWITHKEDCAEVAAYTAANQPTTDNKVASV